MFKTIGIHQGLVAHGFLPYHGDKVAAAINSEIAGQYLRGRQEKVAASASSGMPNAQETAAGATITQQDLQSFEKILSMLYGLYQQYQMQGGGAGPNAAMANQAQAAGIMQAGGMSPMNAQQMPSQMPGAIPGMPPGMMTPGAMPMQTPGGMPPGGM